MKKILLILMLVSTYAFANSPVETPYLSWVQSRCEYWEVPVEIAIAVAVVESNFIMKTSSKNSNGSYDIGIFQLNSQYVDWFEETLWHDWRGFNPNDPHDNIEMGIIYLRYLHNQTGDWEETIKAYNTGLNGLKLKPESAWNYFTKVMETLITMEVRGL